MKILNISSLILTLSFYFASPDSVNQVQIKNQTGIYFDSWGYVQLYGSKWKLVTYINMEQMKDSLGQIKRHSRSLFQFCDGLKNRTWYSYTGCQSFRPYVNNKIRQLERLRDILADYLQAEQTHRTKRGVLDFVGQVSKILFGTLDEDDAKYYTSKIGELEGEQKTFLRVAHDQMLVIKSAITTFNSTMRDVQENERILKNGLLKLNDRVNNVTLDLVDETQMIAMISEHRVQIERTIDECQNMLNLITDSLVHAQDGTLQPELITPMQIKKIMSNEHPYTGLDYPVTLSSQELMKIITPHIYLQGKYLVYLLEIPLILPETYQMYKILPFPTPGKRSNETSKYIYIESTKDFIISDPLHQKFAKVSQHQMDTCFKINELTSVCKETFPILTYKAGEDCEATLLHPSSTEVPSSCSRRMMEIKNTLWIKLFGNEWLYVSPRPEIFTFLCENEQPKSITLKGRGRIELKPGCKGYSAHTTIYAYATLSINVTFPDIIPIPSIDFDCCIAIQDQSYLDKIELNLPISNILSHSDELKITSHKIDEVNDLINDEKWKIEHSEKLHYTSWLTTFGILTLVAIIGTCCSCCCCKSCRRFGFWLYDRWQPMDCMDSMKKHCFLQQHIHTGNVHYHGSAVSLPITSSEQTDAMCNIAVKSKETEIENNENTPISSRTRFSNKKKQTTNWRSD